jgi:hypothetical protein
MLLKKVVWQNANSAQLCRATHMISDTCLFRYGQQFLICTNKVLFCQKQLNKQ